MSSRAVAAAWACDADLTASARLVLLWLADQADSTGTVVAHTATVAEGCRMPERTVRNVLAAMIANEVVDVIETDPGKNTKVLALWPNDGLFRQYPPQRVPYDGNDCREDDDDRQNLPDDQQDDYQDMPIRPVALEKGAESEPFQASVPSPITPVEPEPQRPPVAVYRAPSAPPAPQPNRLLPPHFPPGDMATVLGALGVKPPELPAFWWRNEHREDLANLLSTIGVSAAELVEFITLRGIKAPDLTSIDQIRALLRG